MLKCLLWVFNTSNLQTGYIQALSLHFFQPFLESRVTIFSCLHLFPPQSMFLFPFRSIYWSDGVTSWLPGGRPRASGVPPGGGWVKCRCGGWFPAMKYQYFALRIYCRLTKHDTVSSRLGNASLSAVLSSCDDKKHELRQETPQVSIVLRETSIIIYSMNLHYKGRVQLGRN